MTMPLPENPMLVPAAGLRGLLVILVLAALLAAPAGVAGAASEEACEVPPELSPGQDPLPGLARALKDPATATIVVLGALSSGTKGQASGSIGYPARLQERLVSDFAARGADVRIKVQTIGKTRALAGDLAALINRQVLPLKPALVLWQVGRADARHGNPPHRFSNGIAEGLDTLQRNGIDTILLDIPFHPQFEALYRTDDYRDYLRWLAGKRDLPFVRRYEMIEHWASSGLIDLDSGEQAVQQAAYDFIQECTAYQAARMIIGGAGLAR